MGKPAFEADFDTLSVASPKASLYRLQPVKYWVWVRAYRVNEAGKGIYGAWSKVVPVTPSQIGPSAGPEEACQHTLAVGGAYAMASFLVQLFDDVVIPSSDLMLMTLKDYSFEPKEQPAK